MINVVPPPKGKISDSQFKFLTDYLSTRYGLRIPAEKRVLLESRLISRLNLLKLNSIEEYIDFTFKSKEPNTEYQYFIEQITTHKTFFFRENYQFEFLSKNLNAYMGKRPPGQLNVWSAGCSTGEEVYTLGMILNEKKSEMPLLDYKIIGTDISIPSLKKAAKGIFTNELENLPDRFKEKYFTTTQTPSGIKSLQFNHSEIKSKIQLGVLNLNNKVYNVPHTFDFVFCRNVTIYFDAHTRNQVLGRIVDKIRPGGYLFLGHSETALGTDLPIKSIQPTVYQKRS
jgi:chemotaxis protein methyltransferase CheR